MLFPALLLSEKPAKRGVCVCVTLGCSASLWLLELQHPLDLRAGGHSPQRPTKATTTILPMPASSGSQCHPCTPPPASRPGKVNRNRKGSLKIHQGWKGARKEKSVPPLLGWAGHMLWSRTCTRSPDSPAASAHKPVHVGSCTLLAHSWKVQAEVALAGRAEPLKEF